MITCLIEKLELPNFGQMNTSTTYIESCDETLLVTPWRGTITSESLFQNIYNFEEARSS